MTLVTSVTSVALVFLVPFVTFVTLVPFVPLASKSTKPGSRPTRRVSRSYIRRSGSTKGRSPDAAVRFRRRVRVRGTNRGFRTDTVCAA